MAPSKTAKQESIQVGRLKQESVTVTLLGTTGLYAHRMSAKAKRQLMLGGRKKTVAERAKIKHHPRDEFVDSMHIMENFHEHSHVAFPAMSIKAAMATAALHVPGITKTSIQRLVYLPDEMVPIFGIPKLRMDVVRSADAARTPDVRTRAYFQEWATQVTIRFARPELNRTAIVNLLENAGMICGIGDFRQEKGKGSYGTFTVINAEDVPADLFDRDAQWAAIQEPQPANIESIELLEEYDAEVESTA